MEGPEECMMAQGQKFFELSDGPPKSPCAADGAVMEIPSACESLLLPRYPVRYARFMRILLLSAMPTRTTIVNK